MIEQLGLIGTIRDEEQSPEEPDSESEQDVGSRFGSVRRRSGKCVFVFIHTVSEFKKSLQQNVLCYIRRVVNVKKNIQWKCIFGFIFYSWVREK